MCLVQLNKHFKTPCSKYGSTFESHHTPGLSAGLLCFLRESQTRAEDNAKAEQGLSKEVILIPLCLAYTSKVSLMDQ